MIRENFVFVRVSNGIERKYNYRLVQNILKDTNVYGIEIERIDYIGDEVIDSYKESVEFMSPDEDKVRAVLVMLYDNQVSPLHLVDIVGEFTDNSVHDFAAVGL